MISRTRATRSNNAYRFPSNFGGVSSLSILGGRHRRFTEYIKRKKKNRNEQILAKLIELQRLELQAKAVKNRKRRTGHRSAASARVDELRSTIPQAVLDHYGY
jgi:hypothetical protein